MINEVTSGLRQYQQQTKARSVPQAGTFAQALAGNLQHNKPAPEVPYKWTGERSSDVFGAVAGFMRENYGIDIYSRAPSHELTAEQKAWLCSKYDFSTFRVSVEETFIAADGTVQGYCHHTQEYRNFLGDLVYLNVLSPEEANSLSTVIVPTHAAVFRSGTFDAEGERADTFTEAMKKVIERQRGYIDYISDKSKDPMTAQPEDIEYLLKANGFLADKLKLYDILFKAFSLSENHPSDGWL